jgi:hypothetical protein
VRVSSDGTSNACGAPIPSAIAGRIADPLAGRATPTLQQTGGRGMWLVNQLCELVQVRSTDHGVTVRVHASLEPEHARSA